MKFTTIRISRDVRDELAKLGDKDTSFDAIIRKILSKQGDKHD